MTYTESFIEVTTEFMKIETPVESRTKNTTQDLKIRSSL